MSETAEAKARAALVRYKTALRLMGDDDLANLPLAAEVLAGFFLIAKGVMTKLEFYEALAVAAEKCVAEGRTDRPAPRPDVRVN
jgi:hypothetical protein